MTFYSELRIPNGWNNFFFLENRSDLRFDTAKITAIKFMKFQLSSSPLHNPSNIYFLHSKFKVGKFCTA